MGTLFGEHTLKQDIYEALEIVQRTRGLSWAEITAAVLYVLAYLLGGDE